MRSTSRSHRRCFLAQMRKLKTAARMSSFPNISTSLPSWSKLMNLEQGTRCAHTGECHHSTRSSSSTSQHQCLPCTSAASCTSWPSSRGLQAKTPSRRSTIRRSAVHICSTTHQSVDLSTAMLTASSTSANTRLFDQRHTATSRPTSLTCCML